MEMSSEDKRFIQYELEKLSMWLGKGEKFNPSALGWQRTAVELDALSLYIRNRLDPSYPSVFSITPFGPSSISAGRGEISA